MTDRISIRALDPTGADATNDTPRYNPATGRLEYGPGATAAAQQIRETLTASADDQILTLGGMPTSAASPYVWVNGALLWPGSGYSIADNVIDLADPLLAGDSVWLSYDTTDEAPGASALSAPVSPGYAAEILADSPLAYYRLGESSGSILVDSSGNGRDGTISASGVTLGAVGVTADGDTAWTLNGAGHGDVPGAAWQRPATITLEAWIKTTATDARSILDRDMNSSRAWQFRVKAGKVEFIKIGGGVVTMTGVASVNDGAWHHVAFTHDGTTATIYVDGAVDKSQAMAAISTTATDALTIGANRSGGYTAMWIGDLDEAAMYGTALSASRIAAHYGAA